MGQRRTHQSTVLITAVLILLLALPYFGVAPAQAAPIQVTRVTVKEFLGKVVIGVVATGRILYHVTELAPPNPRIAVDLLDAVPAADLPRVIEVGKGNVIRLRVGLLQDSPPIARIVLDLVRPATVDVQPSGANILVVNVPAPAAAASEAPPASAPPGTIATAQQTTQAPPGVLRLLEFRNTALTDVLVALAKVCGFNIVTDASVTGNVTLRLVDVTCEEALRFVLDTNNLGFRRIGKNIIVMAAKALEPPPEVPETKAYRLDFGNPDQVRAAIAAAVPGIRVAVDPRTNTLLVTGTSLQHEEVLKVLATLDIRIPQVVIQLHAVEISAGTLRDLGLFGGLGTAPFGSFILDSANNRISFALADVALMLFQLRALVTENKGKILAAPRVAVLDGNKASILLGDRVPIFTVTTQAGVTTTTVSFVDVGVKMEVTPRVNAGGLITMAIRPEVSSVVAIISGPGGQQAPQVATRSAETTLTVRDGQTIVLGGLISQQERRTTVKVPILGDIPIIGELFRFTQTDIREGEVIFLITPQILKD